MADEGESKGCAGAVSRGPLGQIGRLLWFLILCFILFVIGLIKGVIIGPISTLIFFAGHMAVVIGLWPVHVVCTYRSIAGTKRLGILLKLLAILFLPVPLFLWPLTVAIASILVGLGYGFGQPMVATFEAVGEGRIAKFYHSFVDGTLDTLIGSCTVVRDFLDVNYHSYLDYLDEFRVGEPKGGKPIDIKLRELPACLLVGILGLLADAPAISLVAVGKSPWMLIKGWQRLVRDSVGRHGPCLDAACVPFAGLAIVFWPLVVAVSVLCAIICSPFFGLFGAVVVYQEMSIQSGLAYIVAVVAEFDEYSNDVLNLRAGSIFPRPKYRKNMGSIRGEVAASKADIENSGSVSATRNKPEIPQLNTQKSLRHTLQEVKIVQVWDHMFKNMEIQGRLLVDTGAIKISDLESYIKASRSPKSKMVAVGIPAYCALQNLLEAAKAGTAGLLLSDGTEVTMDNRPKDRLADWFFEPLLTLKDQLRAAHLQESEERYLEKWILLIGDTERMEAWDNGGAEPEDGVRKGELQALARRLQGIHTSVSRLPTHRRLFETFSKNLLSYARDKSRSSSYASKSTTKRWSSNELDGLGTMKDKSSSKETPPSLAGDDAV